MYNTVPYSFHFVSKEERKYSEQNRKKEKNELGNREERNE